MPDSLSDDLFVGPMHGDFVTSNVLVNKNSIGVIDWEDFTDCGVPIIDLFFFVVDLASTLGKELPFEHTFYERNWFAKIAQRQILKYCKQQDLKIASAKEYIKTYLHYSEELSRALGNDMWAEKANRLRKEYKPQHLSYL